MRVAYVFLAVVFAFPGHLPSQEVVSLSRAYSFQIQELLPVGYGDRAVVHGFRVAGESMFFLLSQGPSTRLKPLILRTNLSGAYLGSFSLPERHFNGLATSSTGSIVVYEPSREQPAFVEYGPAGLLLRRIQVARPVRVFAVQDDLLLSMDREGAVEALDLRKGAVAQVDATPRPNPTLIQPLTRDTVLFIDQVEGSFQIVHAAAGARATLTMPSRELEEARAKVAAQYDRLKTSAPPKARLARPIVVAASARGESGKIYILVSPYNVKRGAVLLELDAGGNLVRHLNCPPAGTFQRTNPSNPWWIGASRNMLFLVSLSGEVAAYRLQW